VLDADRKAVLFVTHDVEEAIALSEPRGDHVGGQAARIIGDWKVALPRRATSPRSRSSPRSTISTRDLGNAEGRVLRGYAQTGGG